MPDQKERKYKNSSRSLVYDKNNVLMGLGQLDTAQVSSEGAFVVEGITDNFGFFKQQLNCSLALGSASLSAGQIGLIRAFNPSRLVLVTDGDIPGVQAAVRDSNKALSYPANYVQLPVFVLPLPEGKDPFDVFYTEGVDIRKYAAKNMLTPKQFLLNHLEFMASAVDSTNRREFEMFLNNETYHIIDDDELVRAAEKHGLKIAAKRKRSIITSPEPAVSFFLGEEFSKRAKAKLRKELPF